MELPHEHGNKSERHKQTLIAAAAIGGLGLTYLIYRRSVGSNAGSSTQYAAATPTADGSGTAGGGASDSSGALSAIGSQLSMQESELGTLRSSVKSLTDSNTTLSKQVTTDTKLIGGLGKTDTALSGLIKKQQDALNALTKQLHAKATTPTAGSKKPATGPKSTAGSGHSYTVVGGDTLTDIAGKLHVNLGTLESNNKAAIDKQGSNDLIHPGLVLHY